MKSEDIKQQNYEKIKSTSSVLFFIQGIEATNMYQIAAASGISKVSIYKHFESKYDIAREILYDRMAVNEKQLTDEWEILPGEFGADQMRRLLERITVISEEDIIFYSIFLEYAMYLQRVHKSLVPQLFDRFDQGIRTLFMDALEKGRRDGSLVGDSDPKAAFETVTGAIRGSCMLFFAKHAGDMSEDYLTDLKQSLDRIVEGFMIMNMPR